MPMTCICLMLALAAPRPTLIVTPLSQGDGATAGMTQMLGETFVGELRRQSSYQVLSYAELGSLLSHEQTKDLIGCSNTACWSEIGAAAGAQTLATGSVGKVGTTWVVALKLIDAQGVRVLASADRRIGRQSSDALLPVIPPMVSELLEQAKRVASESAPPRPAAAVVGNPPPAAFKDEPFAASVAAEKLAWLTDGKGHYLAYDPEKLYRAAVFAGSAERLYAQRVIGGGQSGKQKWSFVFWEPRAKERWRGGFKAEGDTFELQCGETAIQYHPVASKQVARLAANAVLLAVRWQRHAVLLARDDTGRYFFVDQALAPRGNTDYRLFVGTRGKVRHLPLDDAIVDGPFSIFISAEGRFIVRRKGRDQEAAWAVGEVEKPLTLMNLYQQAPMVYTSLGAYAGQALGTACDPHLAP
jgi:TolB-like protein